MLNRRVTITPEEQELVDALCERLSPLGFKAYFYSKEGLKAADRPWRMSKDYAYRNNSVRFFDTFENMERYANRIIEEYTAIENMNVTLKMFNCSYKAEARWYGNKYRFTFFDTNSTRYSKRNLEFDSFDLATKCFHRLVRTAQAEATEEVPSV